MSQELDNVKLSYPSPETIEGYKKHKLDNGISAFDDFSYKFNQVLSAKQYQLETERFIAENERKRIEMVNKQTNKELIVMLAFFSSVLLFSFLCFIFGFGKELLYGIGAICIYIVYKIEKNVKGIVPVKKEL